MAQTQVFLGRANPAAATPGTLYTSPAVTKTMVTSLYICNTSGVSDTVRIWLVPSGGAAGNSNAVYFDMVIPAGNPFLANAVPLLEAGDFIVVQSANGTCTFTASGLTIT